MTVFKRRLLFVLFFLSGFCGLLYQVVWTRMAFASFGIITPVLSLVISVFMLGLSLGAWAGGRSIGPLAARTGLSAAVFYAVAELIIGLGAFAVPKLFGLGEHLLLAAGQTNSTRYLLLSAVVLALSLLPWCVCMGATFPWMMAYVREWDPKNTESFSYLYLANVLGAMCGTLLTAVVLVELLGFRHTLWVAAAANFLIAAASLGLGFERRALPAAAPPPAEQRGPVATAAAAQGSRGRFIQWVLFSTGFAAMAMEVVWIRFFTPVIKTQVYSFALVVFTYLGATFVGSWLYRRGLRRKSLRSLPELLSLSSALVLLPILLNDPRLVMAGWKASPASVVILLLGICPFCALLGYLTPRLVDDYAAGSPAGAGKAYALNVLGCILGPLFASYVLLPWINERNALLLLALPFFAFHFLALKTLAFKQRWQSSLLAGVLLVCALFFSLTHEGNLLRSEKHVELRRDYAASVISYGEGRAKMLLVNGIGMTVLTPITKFMVHLPMAFHQGRPQSALLICFGMGTSFRSALSWDADITAVELVPSVRDAFEFYHADAARCLNNSKGRIIIDDGRRFLKRTRQKFDVIVVDPPPPVEAAGSSLLYSREFYDLAKEHLNPGGILQAWIPIAFDTTTKQAILRSVHESFSHVRVFISVAGWGTHILGSMEPIEKASAESLLARMPESAKEDLREWSSTPDLEPYLGLVLSREVPVKAVLNPSLRVQITDDQPYNEYFLLRQYGIWQP